MDRHRMIHRHFARAVLAAGVLSIGTVASAGGSIAYPASICQPSGSGGDYRLWGGSVYNASTTSELQLMCPVLRDFEVTNGNTLATFGYLDRDPQRLISCTFYSERVTGSSLFQHSIALDSSAATSENYHWDFEGASSISSDAAYFVCSIPRAGNGKVSHITDFYVIG